MVEEQVFRPSGESGASLKRIPEGGRVPTGVYDSNHSYFWRFETGTRPNGAEYSLEIHDNGKYELEVLESPWSFMDEEKISVADEDNEISGYLTDHNIYQDLNNEMDEICYNDEIGRIDDFIDFLIDRELR